MQRGERVLSRLLLQEVPHRVVEAEGAPVEIERKQEATGFAAATRRSSVRPSSMPAGLAPKPRRPRRAARPRLPGRRPVPRSARARFRRADPGSRRWFCAMALARSASFRGVEGGQAFLVQPLVRARDGLAQAAHRFLFTRSRRKPLTSFRSCAHSPSRCAKAESACVCAAT